MLQSAHYTNRCYTEFWDPPKSVTPQGAGLSFLDANVNSKQHFTQ